MDEIAYTKPRDMFLIQRLQRTSGDQKELTECNGLHQEERH
jgi:hypothetical protein